MKIVHTSYIGYIDTKVCGMNGPYAKAILSKIIFSKLCIWYYNIIFQFCFHIQYIWEISTVASISLLNILKRTFLTILTMQGKMEEMLSILLRCKDRAPWLKTLRTWVQNQGSLHLTLAIGHMMASRRCQMGTWSLLNQSTVTR